MVNENERLGKSSKIKKVSWRILFKKLYKFKEFAEFVRIRTILIIDFVFVKNAKEKRQAYPVRIFVIVLLNEKVSQR